MSEEAATALAELALEKYAEAKGLDVNEVKQKWLPVLSRTEKKDPFTERLTAVCSTLGQIEKVGEGLDPNTRRILDRLSSVAVNRALNEPEEPSSFGDPELERVITRIKILDHAFRDPDQAYEKIAEKISQQVSSPVTEALNNLKSVLEKLPGAEQKNPEVVQSEEYAELKGSIENLNTTLARFMDRSSSPQNANAPSETDVDTMVDRIEHAKAKAQAFLEKSGYKIVAGESPASLDEAKKIIESHGYRVQDSRVTREEAERMANEAADKERKKHDDDLELKLEERKIEAAEKVVGTAIDKVMEPFTMLIDRYMNLAVEAVPVPGTTVSPTATPTAPSTTETTASASPIVRIEGPPPQPLNTLKPPGPESSVKGIPRRARKS